MSYFFSDAARVEHLEHVAYYEEQRTGLGARYLAAFESAMAMICQHPDRFRVELAPAIRRYQLQGFPFSVLYRESGSDVEVLVVAPHRRRPGYWMGRH